MNKLLHNNTLFTLTLLGIATALAFLFFSFVSENTANIALLYIIAQILIARYTNGYLHVLFSSVFSVICINFFFTYQLLKRYQVSFHVQFSKRCLSSIFFQNSFNFCCFFASSAYRFYTSRRRNGKHYPRFSRIANLLCSD